MVFGVDLFGLAKKEALKPDFNKNKIPDALEALDAGEAACDVLGNFLSMFDAQDVTEIVAMLPPRVRGKISPLTVVEVGKAVETLPGALKVAKAALEGLELELKRK